MLNQGYIFELLRERNIETLTELSKTLGVNYFTLRYGLNTGNLRLDLAVLIADFLRVPVSSLLLSKKQMYIRLVQWQGKTLDYGIADFGNIYYLMFCILSSEFL